MNMGCGPSIYKEQKMTIKINTKIKIYLYTTWQNQIHYLPKIWGYCCHRHKFLQSSLKGRSRMWNGNTWKNNNNYLHFMKVNWNISPPFNPYSFYISYINFLGTKSSSRKKNTIHKKSLKNEMTVHKAHGFKTTLLSNKPLSTTGFTIILKIKEYFGYSLMLLWKYSYQLKSCTTPHIFLCKDSYLWKPAKL